MPYPLVTFLLGLSMGIIVRSIVSYIHNDIYSPEKNRL